ncbi:MAG: hypothetical protein KF784_11540 [Fimbriimonadaceae bacterium]|nr:hypothetical protein [Fimbriimonadaceae bacterium]
MSKTSLVVFSIVLTAGILIAFAGCKREATKPVSLVVAIDVSCPSPELTNRYGAALYSFQRRLDSQGDLTVLAFANTSRTIYQGPPIHSRGTFNQRIGQPLLATAKAQEKPGTQTALVLTELVKTTERSKLPVVAIVITDGGIEDMSAHVVRCIRESIGLLSKNPKLECLVVAGVLPEHRTRWSNWLEPLGDKGFVRGSNDSQEMLIERIRLAQSGGSQ